VISRQFHSEKAKYFRINCLNKVTSASNSTNKITQIKIWKMVP